MKRMVQRPMTPTKTSTCSGQATAARARAVPVAADTEGGSAHSRAAAGSQGTIRRGEDRGCSEIIARSRGEHGGVDLHHQHDGGIWLGVGVPGPGSGMGPRSRGAGVRLPATAGVLRQGRPWSKCLRLTRMPRWPPIRPRTKLMTTPGREHPGLHEGGEGGGNPTRSARRWLSKKGLRSRMRSGAGGGRWWGPRIAIGPGDAAGQPGWIAAGGR